MIYWNNNVYVYMYINSTSIHVVFKARLLNASKNDGKNDEKVSQR